jgi:hypothetical protein
MKCRKIMLEEESNFVMPKIRKRCLMIKIHIGNQIVPAMIDYVLDEVCSNHYYFVVEERPKQILM